MVPQPGEALSGIMARAVFLDRDGVIIRAMVRDGKPYPPENLQQVELDHDATQALADLRRADYLLILITNQPDVARGTQDQAVVEAINSDLCTRLSLDDCLVCYHDDRDSCNCRKPRPGLILRAAQRHNIDLTRSFVIGDRWRDIDAGHAAGCRTVFIDHGYQERLPANPPDASVTSLKDAATWILIHP